MRMIGESQCGHCTYIISGKEIFVGEAPAAQLDGKPWSQLRGESLLIPSKESYAPIAAYMINACKVRNCSAEIDKFKVRLAPLKLTH